MGTTTESIQVKPVVAALLERAERFAADREFDHASAFFRAAVAADLTPVSRISYGVFLADSERDVAARGQLQEAWEMAKRQGLCSLRALACHNLAALYRRQGQSQAADGFQQLAIRAHYDGASSDPLPVYLIAGRALDIASQESVAAERLWTAAQIDRAEAATALQNQAVVAYRQQRETLAMQRFRAAFEVAQNSHDLNACAAILTNIAHLERQRGRWSVADECLALAERIEREAMRNRSAQQIAGFRRELVRGLAMLAADPSWN